jgi:hypothetical protein
MSWVIFLFLIGPQATPTHAWVMFHSSANNNNKFGEAAAAALHCIAQIELIGNNFGYRWVCDRVDNVTNSEKPKHCQRLWNTESLPPQHCQKAFFSRRKKNAKEESVGHKHK